MNKLRSHSCCVANGCHKDLLSEKAVVRVAARILSSHPRRREVSHGPDALPGIHDRERRD